MDNDISIQVALLRLTCRRHLDLRGGRWWSCRRDGYSDMFRESEGEVG